MASLPTLLRISFLCLCTLSLIAAEEPKGKGGKGAKAAEEIGRAHV